MSMILEVPSVPNVSLYSARNVTTSLFRSFRNHFVFVYIQKNKNYMNLLK